MNTTEDLFPRLRHAAQHLDEAASQIPPLSPQQVHGLIEDGRPSQIQLRRQADRYQLIFCLLLLVLVASLLRYPASLESKPLNVAIVVLSLATGWAALRAARSLWLMRQTRRLRYHPYRMARYADRLGRLSRLRRWWLGLVLRGSYGASSVGSHSRVETFRRRRPSYAIAACLLLIVAINSNKTFAATRDYVKVTTTTEKSDTALCDTLSNIILQL